MLMRLECFNHNLGLQNGRTTATASLNPVESQGTGPSISTSRDLGIYTIDRTPSLTANVLAEGDLDPCRLSLVQRPE